MNSNHRVIKMEKGRSMIKLTQISWVPYRPTVTVDAHSKQYGK